MNDICSNYGLALFEIAKEKDKVKSLQEETKEIIYLLKTNYEFVVILSSAFHNEKDKKEMIDRVFKDFDVDLLSFIHVIVEHNRSEYLIDILYSFNSLCNDYFNVKEGFVYTALPLKRYQINKLEEKISSLENTKIELINKIDTSIIGGLKIIVGSHVYDASILNKINSLKENLLSKGGR